MDPKRGAATTCEPPLLRWAELVLPWLPPPDLASAALACKSLYGSASAITAQRATDAARGLEKRSIPFLNSVDSTRYAYFLYAPFPLLSLPTSYSQPWGGGGRGGSISLPASLDSCSDAAGLCSGCSCEGDCASGSSQLECPCAVLRPDFSGSDGPDVEVMTECGVECECGEDCGNRRTQGGVLVELEVVKDKRKGWGLHAAEVIRKGQFICEYSGEFLTTEEARRRQKIYDSVTKSTRFSPALLVVREHLPSGKGCLRVNIDATRIGNVARFINHSCDAGNLSSILFANSLPGRLNVLKFANSLPSSLNVLKISCVQ